MPVKVKYMCAFQKQTFKSNLKRSNIFKSSQINHDFIPGEQTLYSSLTCLVFYTENILRPRKPRNMDCMSQAGTLPSAAKVNRHIKFQRDAFVKLDI